MSSSAASGDADDGDARARATIPVICGPTASGKSAIAMQLAQRREITIISADSRQIYRRFDLGTAKPTVAETRAVPHRGIDIVEATDRYSAAQWADLADRSIDESLRHGRLPVIVGGTGFYISALFRPLFAEPDLDAGARRQIQESLAHASTDELRRWCLELDPARAHLGRAQLLRAIEVALMTGERLSDLHCARARSRRFRASYLLVDPGPDLATRIWTRATAMLDRGWPDEVRTLMRDVPEHAPAWGATGYETVRRLVRGEIDRAAALERVVIDTRQYAKRQRTWFRHQLAKDHVMRVGGDADEQTESMVDGWMSEVEAGLRALQRDDGRGGA
jgi:tRNA dimethylallyltransferase